MKIKLLFVSMILFGCGEHKKSTPIVAKYKAGDVVYLKPDSTKAVIDWVSHEGLFFGVKYKTEFGKIETLTWVSPSLFY